MRVPPYHTIAFDGPHGPEGGPAGASGPGGMDVSPDGFIDPGPQPSSEAILCELTVKWLKDAVRMRFDGVLIYYLGFCGYYFAFKCTFCVFVSISQCNAHHQRLCCVQSYGCVCVFLTFSCFVREVLCGHALQ